VIQRAANGFYTEDAGTPAETGGFIRPQHDACGAVVKESG
jgi:hypothetical protein